MKNMDEEQKEITFEDFQKVDIRLGKIMEVAPVPNSKKLLRIVVDFGTEERQAIAGLSQYYKPEELIGKMGVFVINIQRRLIAGLESQCMILAAQDEQGNVTLLQPEKDIVQGSKIG
jgi:methionyl-tRNA synthetase